MKPVYVMVHEVDHPSSIWENQQYPFKEFETRAVLDANVAGRAPMQGALTAVTVIFDDRSTFRCNMNLSTGGCYGFQDLLSHFALQANGDEAAPVSPSLEYLLDRVQLPLH